MNNENRERKISHCNEPPLFFLIYMNQHPTLQPYHTTPPYLLNLASTTTLPTFLLSFYFIYLFFIYLFIFYFIFLFFYLFFLLFIIRILNNNHQLMINYRISELFWVTMQYCSIDQFFNFMIFETYINVNPSTQYNPDSQFSHCYGYAEENYLSLGLFYFFTYLFYWQQRVRASLKS